MNISSTKLHLTQRPSLNPKPQSDKADERIACRQDLRNMVTEADNKLVMSTLSYAASAISAVGALGLHEVMSSNFGAVAGIAGGVAGGLATIGLVMYGRNQSALAKTEFSAAMDKADETGCYTREELYQWYEANFG